MARIPSPVQKKYHLLLSLQPLPDLLLQQPAEYRTVLRFQFFPQIHHMNLRHLCPSRSLCEPVHMITSLSRRQIGFHRRSGRSQHDACPCHGCPLQCHLPGMVFGRTFTFITVFMFLIHNDQTQVRKGNKQGRPGTYDNINLTFFSSFILIISLSV